MIILLGAHGTGKTTLLSELRNNRPDLYVTDGFSRPIKSAFLKMHSGVSEKDKQIMINELTCWNWKNNLDSEIYVSSRSVIDCYVYCRAFKWFDLSEEMLAFYKQNLPSSATYLYLPIEFPLQDDGMRYRGVEFQKEIDNILTDFITIESLSPITLSGSLYQRVDKLLKII